MMNAMKVMKYILKERFGFKQLLFVFSGRRGVHIWVCDKRARQLTDAQRKAIVDYISFSKTSYKVDYNLQWAKRGILRLVSARRCFAVSSRGIYLAKTGKTCFGTTRRWRRRRRRSSGT